jgi:hypothetical protein
MWMVELFAGKLMLVSQKPQLLTQVKEITYDGLEVMPVVSYILFTTCSIKVNDLVGCQ